MVGEFGGVGTVQVAGREAGVRPVGTQAHAGVDRVNGLGVAPRGEQRLGEEKLRHGVIRRAFGGVAEALNGPAVFLGGVGFAAAFHLLFALSLRVGVGRDGPWKITLRPRKWGLLRTPRRLGRRGAIGSGAVVRAQRPEYTGVAPARQLRVPWRG